MTPLPDGWHSETLGETTVGGLFVDGDWVESKDQDPAGGVRLTQLADVGVGEFRDRSDRWLREDQAARLGCTFLEPGDVLVARMPEPLGRACVVPENIGRAVTVVDVAIMRPNRNDILPKYLMWALNSPGVHERMVTLQSGTTRKRISRRNLASISLPVPPLDEQSRIVGILEDHLSRLDAAYAYLDAAARRARSLTAAALTRLAHPDDPQIPLAELAMSSGYGTSTKCVPDGPGIPVVRIPNLRAGIIDLSDEKRAADPAVNLSTLMLTPGDLLFVRTNGSRDLIGRTAVVQPGIEASFASYLIRYRIDPSRASPDWLHLMLNRPEARRTLEGLAASSAGQYNLSLGKLDGMAIPLPELGEQRYRVANYNGSSDSVESVDKALTAAQMRSESLRRALLAAAFSGRLTGHSSDLDHAEEMASA